MSKRRKTRNVRGKFCGREPLASTLCPGVGRCVEKNSPVGLKVGLCYGCNLLQILISLQCNIVANSLIVIILLVQKTNTTVRRSATTDRVWIAAKRPKSSALVGRPRWKSRARSCCPRWIKANKSSATVDATRSYRAENTSAMPIVVPTPITCVQKCANVSSISCYCGVVKHRHADFVFLSSLRADVDSFDWRLMFNVDGSTSQ